MSFEKSICVKCGAKILICGAVPPDKHICYGCAKSEALTAPSQAYALAKKLELQPELPVYPCWLCDWPGCIAPSVCAYPVPPDDCNAFKIFACRTHREILTQNTNVTAEQKPGLDSAVRIAWLRKELEL